MFKRILCVVLVGIIPLSSVNGATTGVRAAGLCAGAHQFWRDALSINDPEISAHTEKIIKYLDSTWGSEPDYVATQKQTQSDILMVYTLEGAERSKLNAQRTAINHCPIVGVPPLAIRT